MTTARPGLTPWAASSRAAAAATRSTRVCEKALPSISEARAGSSAMIGSKGLGTGKRGRDLQPLRFGVYDSASKEVFMRHSQFGALFTAASVIALLSSGSAFAQTAVDTRIGAEVRGRLEEGDARTRGGDAYRYDDYRA